MIGTKITPDHFFFFEIFEETFAAGVIKRISPFFEKDGQHLVYQAVFKI